MPSLLDVSIKRCGYPGGFELRNIEFTVDKGDILLITGRSGSGKTTIVRAITGTLEAAGGFLEGSIMLEGRDLSDLRPEEIYKFVSYMPQEPWYSVAGYTVYTEVCYTLALEGVNCSEVDFTPLGISRLANRLTYTLSAGELQRVIWLEALVKSSKLLVLDEPLVYLDQEARKIVKHFIKVALHRDMGVIIVDHDPNQWGFLEPRILHIDNGTIKYYGPWRDDLFPQYDDSLRKLGVEKEAVVVFRNVWFKHPGGEYIIKNFTETFKRGVITCITGPNGSGKTTMLKLGAGVLKPSKGVVNRLSSTIYIPENPLLYFTMPTPREELLLSSRGDENKVVDTAEKYGIKHALDRPLSKLSSGERKRLAIASAYLAGYDVYFIDEPTGGLDNDNSKIILESLQSLIEENKAVVVASHDERVLKVADRIITLGQE
ncbi:MAG: ATP-binding cassette domain-containing protein [Desulfurococcaceae archaeon]